jgi:biotin synthase-related radical SAM superfamily protein
VVDYFSHNQNLTWLFHMGKVYLTLVKIRERNVLIDVKKLCGLYGAAGKPQEITVSVCKNWEGCI